MTQPTRTLPHVDESLVASWPAGPQRAAARRAYRMMLSAGAALEDLLADTPTTDLTAPYAGLPVAEQLAHASHALTALRAMTDRADVAWSIAVPKREWSGEPVELCGALFGWELPPDTSTADEAEQWAALLDDAVVEDHQPRLTQLAVKGRYLDVPVDLALYLPRAERTGGTR